MCCSGQCGVYQDLWETSTVHTQNTSFVYFCSVRWHCCETQLSKSFGFPEGSELWCCIYSGTLLFHDCLNIHLNTMNRHTSTQTHVKSNWTSSAKTRIRSGID